MARSFWSRLVGLLGRTALSEGEALIMPHCRSIHTLGMRFPIDVVFVDRDWRVVSLKSHLSPGRVTWPVWNAWGVVEVASGTLARVGLQVGDQLRPEKTLTKCSGVSHTYKCRESLDKGAASCV
jgi:uncharacterized membrane protein (UPF0127 family)